MLVASSSVSQVTVAVVAVTDTCTLLITGGVVSLLGSGGIPSTPEPGSTSKSGYRQLQKGGKNILRDLDKMYILKMLGHYDPKKEGKVK